MRNVKIVSEGLGRCLEGRGRRKKGDKYSESKREYNKMCEKKKKEESEK